MSTEALTVLVGCAITTALTKAAGPVAFGGRALPRWLEGFVGLLAPALLAALVVTQALADEQRIAVGAQTLGVLFAGVAAWSGANVSLCVLGAAALTALVRLVG